MRRRRVRVTNLAEVAHHHATEAQRAVLEELTRCGWRVTRADETKTGWAIWVERDVPACLTPSGALLTRVPGHALRVNYSTWSRVVQAGRR